MNIVEYPEEARKNGEQGRVWVEFVVEKDGSITGVKVVKGISVSLDKEAIRVVKNMPNWIPKEYAGIKEVVRFTIPITFRLG